jgi:lysozyme
MKPDHSAAVPDAPEPGSKAPGGIFAVSVLAAGIAAALLPSEARVLKPYRDSAGIWTVCMGLIGPIVNRYPRDVAWTTDECKIAEAQYIEPMVKQMQRCTPQHVQKEMTYGQWIWLGHWAYNVGTNNYCGANVGRELQVGNHRGACLAMSKWTWITLPKGKVPAGKHKVTRDSAGRVTRIQIDCIDPANKCFGLAKRRDLEVESCLDSLE